MEYQNINNLENNDNAIRKKRIAMSEDILKKIKLRTDRGEKVKSICDALELAKSTVQKWQAIISENNDISDVYKKLKKSGPKEGSKARKLLLLSECVQEDNSLTQNGMAEKMLTSGISVSQPSISLYLKELEITRKRLKKVPACVFTARIINERKSYSIKYRNVDFNDLLFLDETGFNLSTRNGFGYSPKNTPAFTMVPANRGRNISLLAIISTRGIQKFKILEGPFNTELFLNFIEQCNNLNLFNGKIIIMDNVKFHKSTAILDFFRRNNIRYGFLPPYSPQLNPIEEVFSCLKSRYHKIRPMPRIKEEIITNIENVIDRLNIEINFMNFYDHMKHYLDLAFIGQNFN